MSDRRNFLTGVGATLLGAAAVSNVAEAADNNAAGALYGVGLVWNPDLPGPSGQWRLSIYLAVGERGTGLGTLSDPVHPPAGSHITVWQTVQRGNRYQFFGSISASNTPELVGQPFTITALAQGDATRLWLELGGDIFPGVGRITNLRGNASQFSGGPSQIFWP